MNKLEVVQYNNTYHHSICKETINAAYSALIKKIETNLKAPKYIVRITNDKNIFGKGYTETRSREIFIADSALKTNPWAYEAKDLNGEKIIGSYFEKELLLSEL